VSEDALRRQLEALLGRATEPQVARDAVNPAMIRHWCDAVEDANPVYTDPVYAEKSIHGGLVAPPTMMQAWTMPGLRLSDQQPPTIGPVREVLRLLDEAGFTSVVATNCRQQYRRYLREGDLLSVTTSIEAVSSLKQTALGAGHFVNQLMIYRDQQGEEVGRMQFRLLKFRPPAPPADPARGTRDGAKPHRRPRPARTRDNAFFWEGVEEGRLLVQRCSDCGRLQHPPGPMCPACQSLRWEAVEASGRGRVFSYVVAHHPPVPPFEYPNAIVLVELEEGTRLVSNLLGIDPSHIQIGMPLRVEFTRVDDELVLPLFRPVEAD
jgi:uncharacterized OB-fold protein